MVTNPASDDDLAALKILWSWCEMLHREMIDDLKAGRRMDALGRAVRIVQEAEMIRDQCERIARE